MISNIDKQDAAAPQDQDWTEEEYYDREIVPLMKELAAKCEARKLPHLISINYSITEQGVGAGTILHLCDRLDTGSVMAIAGNIASGKLSPDQLLRMLLLDSVADKIVGGGK